MSTGIFLNRFGFAPQDGGDLILFLHGAGMDSSVWAQQGRYLAAQGWPVVAPDLPGHGQSGGDALTSVQDLAGWLAELALSFNPERLVLLGHSMGALVALHAAADLGGRCTGLVLLGAAGEMPVHPDLIVAAQDDLPAAAALIGDWAFASGIEARFQPSPGFSSIWQARRLLERSRPGVLATDLRACAEFALTDDRLSRVKAHSLAIAGGRDRMAPARKCADLARRLGGEIETFAESGHMMMAEEPARLRRLLFNRLSGWLAREG